MTDDDPIDPADLRAQLLAAVAIERLALEAAEAGYTEDRAALLEVALDALKHRGTLADRLRDLETAAESTETALEIEWDTSDPDDETQEGAADAVESE